jgi:hypothetical protein
MKGVDVTREMKELAYLCEEVLQLQKAAKFWNDQYKYF